MAFPVLVATYVLTGLNCNLERLLFRILWSVILHSLHGQSCVVTCNRRVGTEINVNLYSARHPPSPSPPHLVLFQVMRFDTYAILKI